jgi:meiosis-specific transcription factor NDT80
MTPATAVSPTMGSLASPSHDHGSNGLGVNTAGPPLSETHVLTHLSSADGHQVHPEIHARVDKGFFLSDRDWTCYRRNYFSVICSYSLMPATYSLPIYLRRTPNSQPEHILSFAMCISAVVDSVGGKTVELVQHTPKRDKGPQHKPQKIKLSPQPAGGMYAGTNSNPVISQQGHPSQSGMEHEYAFPGQAQQQQQHQHIAVFDRIQFKSATANNGKRRAAQQYYHLIVELYADVGNPASSAPGQPNAPGGDERWVKIAHRISAPMVVRGRSPGHYADERRQSSTSSPGGGSAGGNQQGGPHPSPHTSGGSGYMGTEGLSSAGPGGSGHGMNNLQHMASPPTNHHPASASPASHYTPIDPNLSVSEEASPQIPTTYGDYTYVPSALYESAHLPPPPSVDSGYETTSYNGDRKSEHPLDTSCSQYENEISAYIPSTVASAGGADSSYRKTIVKEEFSPAGAVPWHPRFTSSNNLFTKCGRFETAETSKGYYPDIPPL